LKTYLRKVHYRWAMPLCTTCTGPNQHLYTVYQSETNLRLEQCVSIYLFGREWPPVLISLHFIASMSLVCRSLRRTRHLDFASGSDSAKEGCLPTSTLQSRDSTSERSRRPCGSGWSDDRGKRVGTTWTSKLLETPHIRKFNKQYIL